MPYSGPASAYGTIGKLHTAYFKMVNEQGGINGRKVELITLDDTYSPPKTVEQTRRLVEQDNVVAVVQSVGTAANSAVHKYLNTKKVPQLFVSTGASKWNDPEHFPYTIGFNPSYRLEGRTYAKHILAHTPKAKIAVLYQNDDYGKDLLEGLKEGLGKNVKQIIAEASYEPSDPTSTRRSRP
jgi:ABC-type branched-subunit amino acid transport system substrate-binding protein